jgi:hypothetical protein
MAVKPVEAGLSVRYYGSSQSVLINLKFQTVECTVSGDIVLERPLKQV